MLPNFFIIGAPKCGTASLRSYLFEHPEIFLYPQEIHFFDYQFDKETKWYQRHFDARRGTEKAVGEKTASYIYLKEVPQRIADLTPAAKLIAIFRNPVDRAYSHYWHTVKSYKQIYSFEKALKIEGDHAYIPLGKYIEHVERYLRFFERKQMLFLLFDDLVANPLQLLNEMCEFLEVDSDYVSPAIGLRRNVGWSPKSKWIQWCLSSIIYRKSLQGTFLVKMLKKIENTNKNEGYPTMREKTRRYLLRLYRSYNERLATVIGKDLSAWNQ